MSQVVQLKNSEGKVYPNPFMPVGSIYLSVNNTNPSIWFGGTWEQIEDDAYLKIVSNNAGALGGTSKNHKIPVSSIPAHGHPQRALTSTGTQTNYAPARAQGAWSSLTEVLGTYETGGGEAYYPYYFGIYVWVRVA